MRTALLLLALGCTPDPSDTAADADADTDTDSDADTDTDSDTDSDTDTDSGPLADPFADAVVDYGLGEFSGFGEDRLPDIVLGSPEGAGNMGSLDVLSLGEGGWIVLRFDDMTMIDGPGPDLLVFENAFTGWVETGRVAASADGETWHEWPCAAEEEGATGCAGINKVWATSTNGIDPTDPEAAGGDAFDLADLDLEEARYVRITDTGTNPYVGNAGGFDLDAVAVINGS
jgi:hypothetical protein